MTRDGVTFRPMKVYRVAWRIQKTGCVLHGDWSFDLQRAQRIVEGARERYPANVMLHWIEAQECMPWDL